MHKAYAPSKELEVALRKVSSSICLIQEPAFKKGKVQGLSRKRGNIYHVEGNDRPILILYVSKNWSVHPMYHVSTKDLATAIIKVKKCGQESDLKICSAYFPSEQTVLPRTDEFTRVVDFSTVNKLPLLSGTDANAHHFAWGSSDINPKGDSLLNYILASNLVVLNVGNTPTFITANRSEVLDITLRSKDISTFILDWHVTELILSSNHRCISFKISLDPQPPILFRNPASTNWTYFYDLIETWRNSLELPDSLTSIREVNDLADKFQAAIINAYETACPTHKHKAGPSVPYYTSEDRKQRKIMRKAFFLNIDIQT